MRKHFVPKVGQMRIAAMAGIWQGIDDFGPDVRGALAQHNDAASKEQRFFHIVGHQQRGETRPLPQRDKLALHGDPRQRVELAQRLVENKQRRVVDKGTRQSRALRHAARKLVRISIGEARKPDQAQCIFDALAMAAKQTACFQSERNIAPDRPPRIQGWILKNDDTRGIGPFDRLALYEEAAGAWSVEPRNQPQQSRLAAPARSEEGDELAAADAQADPIQYRQRLSRQVEVMAYFADRESCSAYRVVIYRICHF